MNSSTKESHDPRRLRLILLSRLDEKRENALKMTSLGIILVGTFLWFQKEPTTLEEMFLFFSFAFVGGIFLATLLSFVSGPMWEKETVHPFFSSVSFGSTIIQEVGCLFMIFQLSLYVISALALFFTYSSQAMMGLTIALVLGGVVSQKKLFSRNNTIRLACIVFLTYLLWSQGTVPEIFGQISILSFFLFTFLIERGFLPRQLNGFFAGILAEGVLLLALVSFGYIYVSYVTLFQIEQNGHLAQIPLTAYLLFISAPLHYIFTRQGIIYGRGKSLQRSTSPLSSSTKPSENSLSQNTEKKVNQDSQAENSIPENKKAESIKKKEIEEKELCIILPTKKFREGNKITGEIEVFLEKGFSEAKLVLCLVWESEQQNRFGDSKFLFGPSEQLTILKEGEFLQHSKKTYNFSLEVPGEGPFSYQNENGKFSYFLKVALLAHGVPRVVNKTEVEIFPSKNKKLKKIYYLPDYRMAKFVKDEYVQKYEKYQSYESCFFVLFLLALPFCFLASWVNSGFLVALTFTIVVGLVFYLALVFFARIFLFVVFSWGLLRDTLFLKIQSKIKINKNIFSPGDKMEYSIQLSSRKKTEIEQVEVSFSCFGPNPLDQIYHNKVEHGKGDWVTPEEEKTISGEIQIPQEIPYYIQLSSGMLDFDIRCELRVKIQPVGGKPYVSSVPVYIVPPDYLPFPHPRGEFGLTEDPLAEKI